MVSGWNSRKLNTPAWRRPCQRNATRQLALDLGYQPVVPPLRTRLRPWQYDRKMYKRCNEVLPPFGAKAGFRGSPAHAATGFTHRVPLASQRTHPSVTPVGAAAPIRGQPWFSRQFQRSSLLSTGCGARSVPPPTLKPDAPDAGRALGAAQGEHEEPQQRSHSYAGRLARADSYHLGSYPHAVKKLRASFGVRASMASRIASQRESAPQPDDGASPTRPRLQHDDEDQQKETAPCELASFTSPQRESHNRTIGNPPPSQSSENSLQRLPPAAKTARARLPKGVVRGMFRPRPKPLEEEQAWPIA